MADIRVLIVVDGIMSLTTTYPIDYTQPPFGPEIDPDFGYDAWFTLSHLISTLRNSSSPTFTVDTASRGFNAAGNLPSNKITNSVPDPTATIAGPFRFDDPSIDLSVYDEIWLFGDEGNDVSPVGPPDPASKEPGGLAESELAAITNFMQAGGGLFATGDHDGLGSGMCGRVPRVRYMRKWYSSSLFDANNLPTSPWIPPLAVPNWPGVGSTRQDTLQLGAMDDAVHRIFNFDDQSDDIPQQLIVLVPSHPALQGATGVLTVYPDHSHEGEVIVPTGPQLTQTSANDPSLSFTDPGFTEFPTIGAYQEVPQILAQSSVGSSGNFTDLSGKPIGHQTIVAEGAPCETKNFATDTSTCNVRTNNALAAYDGATVNVGRIVTDSSFHHFVDLNLIGDPCSLVAAKTQGFNASASGQAVLREISAFFVNMATWLAWPERKSRFVMGKTN